MSDFQWSDESTDPPQDVPSPSAPPPPADAAPPTPPVAPSPPVPPSLSPANFPTIPARKSPVGKILGVIAALVVLAFAGCGAFVFFIVDSTSAYVDVANEYVDAHRAGNAAEVDRLWCGGQPPASHTEVLGGSTGQNLSSVSVSNGVGDVEGLLDLSGRRVDVELEVRTVADAACVSRVILDRRILE